MSEKSEGIRQLTVKKILFGKLVCGCSDDSDTFRVAISRTDENIVVIQCVKCKTEPISVHFDKRVKIAPWLKLPEEFWEGAGG